MAKRKLKKKRFTFRFELGLGGLLGTGIVFFCVFLWMFLLGVWVGQTVLLPNGIAADSESLSDAVSSMWQKGRDVVNDLEKEALPSGDAGEEGTVNQEAEPEMSGQSFFSLQVGAFSDEKKAMQAVLAWRARGHASFSLPPEGDKDDLHRVFIGKFDNLAAANVKSEELESDEKLRPYITLLPADKFPDDQNL